MNLNNLYNFKNPIKHFINVDNTKLPENMASLELKNFSWVKPIKFRVWKRDDKYRTLKIPNILNFFRAYEQFKDYEYFNDIQSMDGERKRLSANIETGDFEEGEYDRQLEEDFEKLCIYDNLIRIDIKEYYGRIYTHDLQLGSPDENFISNMNEGATNELIMGNYLSLFLAEKYLAKISNDLKIEFEREKIECEFSYFSDDFYFFCNKYNNDNVIRIFDNVLEQYDLERNEDKKEIWTYESFNNYNLVERYWKKVIAHSNTRFKKYIDDSNTEINTNNKLYFINQLIYRMSKLEDNKLKRVFVNNFFKTKYFKELDLEKYQVKDYDYHQLCFIFKYSPECMIYSVHKFFEMTKFDNDKVKSFFKVRYREILKEPFNDEQLYYYYAIKVFGFNEILQLVNELVLKSKNQILISYYLKDNLFTEDEVSKLKEMDNEKFWFQNYHLILYRVELYGDLENSVNRYLIPEKATKAIQKETYKDFYIENLMSRKSFVRDILEVNEEIDNYLELKYEESEAQFEEGEE